MKLDSNIKIGNGATISIFSDREAYTIIKISDSGKSITLQRDKAQLSKNFKPDFSRGGFLGHVSNNDEQTYEYTPNKDGEIIVARLYKDGKYYASTRSNKPVIFGVRSEFYDYNF